MPSNELGNAVGFLAFDTQSKCKVNLWSQPPIPRGPGPHQHRTAPRQLPPS